MGVSAKYGRVTTEHKDIPADEPVFVLRAQDEVSVAVLDAYVSLSAAHGSDQDHLNQVQETREQFRAWQQEHPGQVKVPDL